MAPRFPRFDPRRALLALVAAALACSSGCGKSGGTEVVTLRLDTDEDCYGVIAVVATTEGPAVDCDASSSLVAAGCDVNVEATATDIEISAHGCFVSDHELLLTCTVPSSVAKALREGPDVRCGCGCSDDCPDNPGLAVCDADGAACAAAAAQDRDDAIPSGPALPTSAGRRGLSIDSTSCGSCCDAGWDTNVRLTSGTGIRELHFDIDVGIENGTPCTIDDCEFAPSITGPTRQTVIAENKRRICIADPTGLDAGQLLMSCSIFTGGSLGEIDQVSALDAGLETASPAPQLRTEEP